METSNLFEVGLHVVEARSETALPANRFPPEEGFMIETTSRELVAKSPLRQGPLPGECMNNLLVLNV